MFIKLLLQYLLQAIIMTSHPVLITQDEEIDLTMDNTDNEEIGKPILTMATINHQVTENLVVQETTPKKTCPKRPLWILKILDSLCKKKIVTPKKTNNNNKKILLKPPDILLKNPKTIPP